MLKYILACAALFTTGLYLGNQVTESRNAAKYAMAQNEILRQARIREHDLQQRILDLERRSVESQKVVHNKSAYAGRVIKRLREEFAKGSGGDAGSRTAGQRAPGEQQVLQSKLFGEAANLARRYAFEADRAIAAGRACEQAYESAREVISQRLQPEQ